MLAVIPCAKLDVLYQIIVMHNIIKHNVSLFENVLANIRILARNIIVSFIKF